MKIIKSIAIIAGAAVVFYFLQALVFGGGKVGLSSENESSLPQKTAEESVPAGSSVETEKTEETTRPEEPEGSSAGEPAESSEESSEESQESQESSEESEPEKQVEEPSLLKLLQTGRLPIGHTLYVWGGGWNEADDGAGIEAVTLGESPRWAEFCSQQGADYDMENTRYQIHDGLDCSGYIGWVVYNTLESENGKEGYVDNASKLAADYSSMGLGELIPNSEVMEYRPGDIVCTPDHVVLVVGQCEDGSILFMHASPPGVSLTGTMMWSGEESEASMLAKEYMIQYYPDWVSYYTSSVKPGSYLSNGSIFRWDENILKDEEGLRNMSVEQILEKVFEGAVPTDRSGKTSH